MKGVILSGGTGSRLRPLTHTGPKQLLPVANKPVLQYAIEDMRAAGIKQIGIVLGNKGREEIQTFLGDGSDLGVDITYIVQGEPLGLAHAVGCAQDFVGGDPFVVYLGDNLMEDGIAGLVQEFDSTEYDAGIGLQSVKDPTRFGVADRNDRGDVVGLVEKPDDPPSEYALVGTYVFTPAIFEQINSIESSWRGEYEITDAIQGLLSGGYRVQSHVIPGWWKDTGRPEDILEANRLVLDDIDDTVRGRIEDDGSVNGRIELGTNSVIEAGAVVRGPVSIGEDTTIGSNAYVGPYTSIGDQSQVDGVHIENSVVVGESTISADTTIVDSLVGRKTTITSKDNRDRKGERLIVGENSELTL